VPVNTPRKDYEQYLGLWLRGRDFYNGNDAVKGKGVEYLPMLDSHVAPHVAGTKSGFARYKEYVDRAVFYNATGRTVDGFAGAIHQKAPEVKCPKDVEKHLEDVTLSGVSAELFALRTTREVMKTGRYGLFLEMSVSETADQRPYWVSYRPEDVVNWTCERYDGEEVLTQVVLRETYDEVDKQDPFVRKTCEQYRVLALVGETGAREYVQTVWRRRDGEQSDFVIYRKPGQTEDYEVPLRRGVALDFIPFTFVGPTSTSAEIEKPPLDDLVAVNLSHYRQSADYAHGLHFTALPTPWVSGVAGDGPLVLGSTTCLVLDAEGKAGMLEFAGTGLAAIRVYMEDLKKMMATLGARLLEEQSSVQETKGGIEMRHAGEQASLRTITHAVETALTKMLRWHVWWVGTAATPEEIGDDVAFELNKDLFAVRASSEDVKAALAAYQAGGMSFATWYSMLQKATWARDGIDAEEEQEEIEAEGGGMPSELPALDANGQPMLDANGQPVPAPPNGQPVSGQPAPDQPPVPGQPKKPGTKKSASVPPGR
jgi:hypothetical protein